MMVPCASEASPRAGERCAESETAMDRAFSRLAFRGAQTRVPGPCGRRRWDPPAVALAGLELPGDAGNFTSDQSAMGGEPCGEGGVRCWRCCAQVSGGIRPCRLGAQAQPQAVERSHARRRIQPQDCAASRSSACITACCGNAIADAQTFIGASRPGAQVPERGRGGRGAGFPAL